MMATHPTSAADAISTSVAAGRARKAEKTALNTDPSHTSQPECAEGLTWQRLKLY